MSISDESVSSYENSRIITIIGTGAYGTALGKRLVSCGFNVIYGSRKPTKAYIDDNFEGDRESIQITTLEDAWCNHVGSNIVFFAVPTHVYEGIVAKLMNNCSQQKCRKTVIDVSNKSRVKEKKRIDESMSNAEYLQAKFNIYTDKVTVVKCFNNISAYSMSSNNISEMVSIAGNVYKVNEKISHLAAQMGFRASQIGSLKKAKTLEQNNESTFSEWQSPTLFSGLFLVFNFIWYFFYSYYSNAKYKKFNEYLSKFSLLPHLNRVFAFTSINMLAYVYLAGCVAMCYQLRYGNRTKRFPRYLDLWLKSRKYLGIWAFIYASWHVFISVCILSPVHFSPWYKAATQPKLSLINGTVSVNEGFKMGGFTLYAEFNLLTGMIAYFIMCVLALTSINSIGMSLNWSEWRFIQSKCGILCLTFSLIHDAVMYSRFIVERDIYPTYTTRHILTRVKLFCLILPTIVLLLRFIFAYFTPLSKRIHNIRNGIVTKSKEKQHENESSSLVDTV